MDKNDIWHMSPELINFTTSLQNYNISLNYAILQTIISNTVYQFIKEY